MFVNLQYERGLKNFKAEQPHQHAIYYASVVLSEQLWTKDELLEALDGETGRARNPGLIPSTMKETQALYLQQ